MAGGGGGSTALLAQQRKSLINFAGFKPSGATSPRTHSCDITDDSPLPQLSEGRPEECTDVGPQLCRNAGALVEPPPAITDLVTEAGGPSPARRPSLTRRRGAGALVGQKALGRRRR